MDQYQYAYCKEYSVKSSGANPYLLWVKSTNLLHGYTNPFLPKICSCIDKRNEHISAVVDFEAVQVCEALFL